VQKFIWIYFNSYLPKIAAKYDHCIA